jgi:hypothetical protein
MKYVEKVTFGTTDLVGSPTVVADWHLRFTMEPMAPGTYDLTLTDKFGQTVSEPGAFTLVAPPVLLSISPEKGGGGKTVTCIGENFRPDHEVLLDGVPTATTYVSKTELTWVTPPGVPGDKIHVGVRDVWGRTSTLPVPYLYAWSEGLIAETFATNDKEDEDFTPTAGGLAEWNPAEDPGKLVSTWGATSRKLPNPHGGSSSNHIPLSNGSWANYFCQTWYKNTLVGAAGTISGFKYVSGSSSIGRATGLSTTRSANFNVGSPVTVINGVTHTLPKSIPARSPVSYPKFTKTFYYDGKSHLTVDTAKTNGTLACTCGYWSGYGKEYMRMYGTPWNKTTGSASTGTMYQCVLEFRTAISMARSLFYRTDSDAPDFLTPIVEPTEQPAGTKVVIEYQGAQADPLTGDPNPLTYTTWTEDPTGILNSRFLRFRVTFTANLTTEKGPALDRIQIPYHYFD